MALTLRTIVCGMKKLTCFGSCFHGGLGSFHTSSRTAIKDDMSDKNAWQKFYASRLSLENFDWFLDFNDIIEHLTPHIRGLDAGQVLRLLDIGCGTSHFGMELCQHLEGNCRIDCIDFSDIAIKQMKELLMVARQDGNIKFSKEGDSTGLFYHVGDIRQLPFESDLFHLVIDKGTSDAVLRGHEGEKAFLEILMESLRVLRPNGKLVQFTDEAPEIRLDLLSRVKNITPAKMPYLQIFHKELGFTFGVDHFMYIVKKCGYD